MPKLKWKYDQRNEEYYTMLPECEYEHTITKVGDKAYKLEVSYQCPKWQMLEHTFSKLGSAKEVADLIENG